MSKPQFDSEEVLRKIARHQDWLAAGGPEGDDTRLVLMDAMISRLRLEDVTLESAVIVRCQVSASDFNRCNLSGALLFDSSFEHCRFLSCDFRKSEMNSATCSSVNFTNSTMTKVDFSHVDLRKADLTNCDMRWSALIDTDLRCAVLENVNLDGARLVGTKLYNDRRFHFAGLNPSVVRDIFLDPDAAGPPLGAEALALLCAE